MLYSMLGRVTWKLVKRRARRRRKPRGHGPLAAAIVAGSAGSAFLRALLGKDS